MKYLPLLLKVSVRNAINIATRAINPEIHLNKCKPGLFVR